MKQLSPEWQIQQSILLTWPHKYSDWSNNLAEIENTYLELVKIITIHQKIILIAYNHELVQDLKKKLSSVVLKNIKFNIIQTNDTWVRDYGPITLSDSTSKCWLNFIFNGWGDKFKHGLDNAMTGQLDLPGSAITIPFVLEGGAIDYNGEGELLTTETCLLKKNRNNMVKENIEKKLKEYLNVKKIHWLKHTHLIGDDTDGHIDMFARFVNKNTIVYAKSINTNDSNYTSLTKLEQELKTLRDTNNKTFNLVPVLQPETLFYKNKQLPTTYINFLIINDAVIVPCYNDVTDSLALAQFEKLFPTRKIYGVDSSVLIRHGGSIHCASMNLY